MGRSIGKLELEEVKDQDYLRLLSGKFKVEKDISLRTITRDNRFSEA